MKKVIALILTLAALLSSTALFASCSKGNEKDGELIIAAGGASDYTIVYPASATAVVKSFAENLQSHIKEVTGAELSIADDTAKEEKHEILIGDTNREATVTAKERLGESAYIVTAVEQKLVICASSDTNYKTALSYLKNRFANEQAFTLAADFCYNGNKITTFVAEEKVTGNTKIDITLNPDSNNAQPGLFVGYEYENGAFGYRGYSLVAAKNTLVLYDVGKNMTEMASKKIKGVKAGEDIKLRIEIEGLTIRGYLLDDAEGITPWPEFEMKLKNECDDYYIGYVELSGNGCTYRDLSITTYDVDKKSSTAYYTNAVYADYADPDVLLYDGTYYLYATGGSGYIVHTSKDLVNWKAGPTVVNPNLWGITKNYWAPDVEYINGKFYMVVSCDEHLGLAVSDSPTGQFKALTENYLYEKTIDGHLFVDDDGKVYLYYVSWRSTYGIYGVELDENMNPIAKTEKRLITPTEEWEKDQGNVTEGPYMLKHNGIYYLTYSGSHYQSKDYAVGYATSDKPLGNYEKYDLNPIMKGNSQIYGTGHHCITTTPDGSEMIIVYHCHNSVTAVQQRKICIDRIRFSPVAGEKDRLEVYGPTVTRQEKPIK